MSADSDFYAIQVRAKAVVAVLNAVVPYAGPHMSAMLRAIEHVGFINAVASAQTKIADAAFSVAVCAGCCDVEDCPCTKVCDEIYCDKHFKEEYDRRFPRAATDSDDKRSDHHERVDE